MNSEERSRIETMEKALPPIQQQQVKVQLTKYRADCVAKGISPQGIEQASFIFWRTIVTRLYATAVPKTCQVAPPPPPPIARKPPPPPPTSTKPPARSAALFYSLVDKSNGLVARLLGPTTGMPVGMQDWVNRVFILADTNGLRPKADAYVTDTVRMLASSSELTKTNWITFPVPSVQELVAYKGGSFLVRKVPEVIDLEPPAKTRKVQKPVEEFIPLAPVVKKRIQKTLSTEEQEELRRRHERAQKYKDHLIGSSSSPEQTEHTVNVQYEFGNDEEDVFEKTGQYSVVGTCKTMEKRYLRLTSAPDPGLVRPEPVLTKWLAELTRLWTSRSKEWKYIEDQMRAIRQDLTVQNLRGAFTRTVYELNARWALESGDLGQFNQCQTQLIQLHENASSELPGDIRAEFYAYRLLYYTFQNLRVDEQIFLNRVLGDTSIRTHPFMQFALRVRMATVTSNFSLYFRLERKARNNDPSAPPHAQYLMHAFQSRQRMQALVVLTRAIATPISAAWLTDMLAFTREEECVGFLTEHGGVMKSESMLDPKSSFPSFSESPLLTSSKLKLMG